VDGSAGDPSAVPMEFSSRKRNEWKECRKIFPDQRILDLVSCYFISVLLVSLPHGLAWDGRPMIIRNVTDIVASSRNPRPR
jgi:hypothetical protein